jgi:peroxiredoxin Q/BCP
MAAAGDVAPGFALTAGDGMPLELASLRGMKVVLFFYPKNMTPG